MIKPEQGRVRARSMKARDYPALHRRRGLSHQSKICITSPEVDRPIFCTGELPQVGSSEATNRISAPPATHSRIRTSALPAPPVCRNSSSRTSRHQRGRGPGFEGRDQKTRSRLHRQRLLSRLDHLREEGHCSEDGLTAGRSIYSTTRPSWGSPSSSLCRSSSSGSRPSGKQTSARMCRHQRFCLLAKRGSRPP